MSAPRPRRDSRPAGWPDPPRTPTEALLHTLDVFATSPDRDFVIVATGNVYGDRMRTGLTWGDLRALRDQMICRSRRLERESAERGIRRTLLPYRDADAVPSKAECDRDEAS